MRKKQHVCHYACAKGFKLWSLIFKDYKDDLRQNLNSTEENQSENPLNIALMYDNIKKKTTHSMTKHILYYAFFPVT